MENTKKQLKLTSFCILIFALISIAKTIVAMVMGTPIPDELPEGLTPDFFQAFVTILNVGALIFVLPVIYVGYKGFKISKGNPCSKAPIVWATILLVLALVSLVSEIPTLISGNDLLPSVLSVLILACDIAIYFLYIRYAKKLQNANND